MTGPLLELTSTSNPVYPQQQVTFTCVTRDSPTLAWRCHDYLGTGSLIEFVLVDTIGESRTVTSPYNSTVTATLTDVDSENRVLASTLRIIASPRRPASNVTCINVGQSLRKDITLGVFGKTNFFDLLIFLLSIPLYLLFISSYACSGDEQFLARTICLSWREY